MQNFESRVQRDLVTDAVFTESNEEFILPDYMPEIGRVLRVSATLLPDDPYPEVSGTEFSGRIEYRLLYGDGEGNITEAPLEGRYRYRLPAHEKSASVIYTEEKIESVGARPSAPRKLSIRTRIYARPHLLTEEEIGVPLSSLLGGVAQAETIERELELLSRTAVSSGTLHTEGAFTIEDTHPDALSLLSVQSAVLTEEKTARDGYISVRGKLVFTMLLKKEGEAPFKRVFEIPYEEEIEHEGAEKGDAVTLRAFIGTPAITMESEGEGTALHIDADFSLSGILTRNRRTRVLEDLYLYGIKSDVTQKAFSGEKLVGCASGNFTVASELPLPADINGDGCLFPSFTLKEASVTRAGERAVVSGTANVHLLSFGEGETGRCELALPFRVELVLPGNGKEETLICHLLPIAGAAEAGGVGVRISLEISVDVTAKEAFTLALPASLIKKGEIPSPADATVILYYPTDNDTLFSVGKRYGVPLSLLREQNGIPEEEDPCEPLDGYAYLFVSKI